GDWALLGAPDQPSFAPEGRPLTAYADTAALRRALDEGAPVPAVLLVPYLGDADTADPLPLRARTALRAALADVQDWLADDRLADTRLVAVTRHAVATAPDEDVTDLVHAPVWGLLRSAQSEHPGRLQLIDTDDLARLAAVLPALIAAGEPQSALRDDTLRVPRLARVRPSAGPAAPCWGDGAVLITGATGTLGAVLARHLVAEHGVRDLVL
ncbi:malonyl CoA-ACP transacylase, partial [Streptomyces sp. SID10815]|nr:malonyl CoA-ACP transacylase [Streptomyces sp. SID10815]